MNSATITVWFCLVTQPSCPVEQSQFEPIMAKAESLESCEMMMRKMLTEIPPPDGIVIRHVCSSTEADK